MLTGFKHNNKSQKREIYGLAHTYTACFFFLGPTLIPHTQCNATGALAKCTCCKTIPRMDLQKAPISRVWFCNLEKRSTYLLIFFFNKSIVYILVPLHEFSCRHQVFAHNPSFQFSQTSSTSFSSVASHPHSPLSPILVSYNTRQHW